MLRVSRIPWRRVVAASRVEKKGWNCWKPLGRGTKWYATCATCKRRAGFVPCLVVANSLFPIILSIVHAPFFNSTIFQDREEKYMINREIKIRENCFEETKWNIWAREREKNWRERFYQFNEEIGEGKKGVFIETRDR